MLSNFPSETFGKKSPIVKVKQLLAQSLTPEPVLLFAVVVVVLLFNIQFIYKLRRAGQQKTFFPLFEISTELLSLF